MLSQVFLSRLGQCCIKTSIKCMHYFEGSNILQGLRKNASYLPAQVLPSMGECAGKAGQLDEGRQAAGNPMAGTNHTKSLVNWKAVTNSRLLVV